MKLLPNIALLAAALMIGAAAPSDSAFAAGGDAHIEDHEFSFDGIFGTYDQVEIQRGFRVYKQGCANCHGLKYLAFRHLLDEDGPAFDPEQVKVMARDFMVPDDGPEAMAGDEREAGIVDHFPTPVAANNPPDLSLMAKARAGGPAYIYSVLTGYTGVEKDGLYENTAFPGGWISMPPPLYDGLIENDDGDPRYQDGTAAVTEQLAHDVSAFLMWAAEPRMTDRKQAGVRNIIFLIIFAALLYFTNKKLWRRVKHPEG